MQHSVKDDFSKELEQAQHTHAKIENMRQLYKLLWENRLRILFHCTA